MLSLTRHTGEKVVIVVPPSRYPTVIEHITGEVTTRGVRQRYQAPSAVRIHRSEVHDRIELENRPQPTKPHYNPDDGYGGAGDAIMKS